MSFQTVLFEMSHPLRLRTSQASKLWLSIQDVVESFVDKDTVILDFEFSVPDLVMNIGVKKFVLIRARSISEKLHLSDVACNNPASPVPWNLWNLGLKHLMKLVHPFHGCSIADHEEHSPTLHFSTDLIHSPDMEVWR